MSKKSYSPSRRSGRGVPYTASGTSRGARASGYAAPTSVTRRAVTDSFWEPDPLILPVDRRLFNPSPAFTRPAQRFSGVPARVVAPPVRVRAVPPAIQGVTPKKHSSKPTKLFKPSALLFQAPKGVAVCVQRGVRKEVLHAKGVAGKSGLAKPKRGPYSGVKCGNL